ncbi:type I restriction enzyme, R subunit [Succinivibrio dextrinosolvens DSM 3072]|uniref:Type I restriction enzyme, R subunit n=1 Tax=Succinivibrio dextrinosolvens DSM 3072 TaxID=1123324 RepID=A0A1T4UXZ7_9GAMM|nr:DEAD/DEAH box helicase family protein [Succinivibrio dextrinosolvens]SKA57603.1 type I restriction enzyme, R subunit [Succinivibrio dextrinosolvens DSM 3072]
MAEDSVQLADLSEEDIKLQFITPAIQAAKWDFKDIRMEYSISDGMIKLKPGSNKAYRDTPKKADYVLFINGTIPLAVVEAKNNKKSVSHGTQQAKEYALKIGAPFAYSSNGDAFHECDLLNGTEKDIPLNQFPSQTELYERFKQSKQLNPLQEKLIKEPFCTGANIKAPRYYQRNAVNATIDAIARGEDRILLALATGTGKTYIAFQIVHRLLSAGVKKRILYLADRNILVDQSIQQDFAPLEKVTHKIHVASEKPETISSYQVYFALYQQLVGDSGEEDHYSQLFSPDFFDLIIVDECHRGSANNDSQWKCILEYFNSATQIGMTATPKETKYASNISYFGEPVYTYSLKDGIEDGFLAPFKVIRYKINIGDEWRPVAGQTDKNGQIIEDRIYNNSDYDYNIVIESRTEIVAEEITKYLKSTDRFAKTIVFTPTEDAAERMRVALVNLNSDIVKEHPDYVVRITGSDEIGKGKLDYFIAVSTQFPVIATTSKLLSTGVDTKMVKVIVLDEMIGSMTEFKQIIGRGTRLLESEGKTNFVVLDFRNVSRMFADPKWDGPVEVDEEYNPENKRGDGGEITPPQPPKYKPIVDKNGCEARVEQKTVSIYDPNGKLLQVESIVDYTKRNIKEKFTSLEGFIKEWRASKKKNSIREFFFDKGINLEELKAEQNLSDVDDFDFICHIAFDSKTKTRKERANSVIKTGFLDKYSGVAREILETLLDNYASNGIYEIESSEILTLPQFMKFGKPIKIAQSFGGIQGYNQAFMELENAIYGDGSVGI